jgi:hypothetical protein
MPIKPESKFIHRVHRKLGEKPHRQKMGTVMMNGTPDYWYSGDAADLWVEYKWVDSIPAHGVNPLKLLSALQALWINRRYAEGRKVVVIIGSPTYCAILEHGAWNDTVPKDQFQYSELDIANWIFVSTHAPSAFSSQDCNGNKSDV